MPQRSRLSTSNEIQKLKSSSYSGIIKKIAPASFLRLFSWRREGDSNSRCSFSHTPLFESGTFNHSDISPSHSILIHLAVIVTSYRHFVWQPHASLYSSQMLVICAGLFLTGLASMREARAYRHLSTTQIIHLPRYIAWSSGRYDAELLISTISCLSSVCFRLLFVKKGKCHTVACRLALKRTMES